MPETPALQAQVEESFSLVSELVDRAAVDGTFFDKLEAEASRMEVARSASAALKHLVKDPAAFAAILEAAGAIDAVDEQSVAPSWHIPIPAGLRIKSPADFVAVAGLCRNPFVERTGVAFLDSNGRIVSAHVLSVGNLTSAHIDRSIVSRARAQCPGNPKHYILWHNHPSGDPSPSQADWQVSQGFRLQSFDGATFSDHIVTNGDRLFSFAKAWEGESGYVYYEAPRPKWELAAREELPNLCEGVEPRASERIAFLRLAECVRARDCKSVFAIALTNQGAATAAVLVPVSGDLAGTKKVSYDRLNTWKKEASKVADDLLRVCSKNGSNRVCFDLPPFGNNDVKEAFGTALAGALEFLGLKVVQKGTMAQAIWDFEQSIPDARRREILFERLIRSGARNFSHDCDHPLYVNLEGKRALVREFVGDSATILNCCDDDFKTVLVDATMLTTASLKMLVGAVQEATYRRARAISSAVKI